LVKADCEKKGIRITVDIDRSAFLVASDKERLEQVFLNLVKNSMEAMDEGGDILIRASTHNDRVEITVTDDGCGISEEDREKIFAPFFTTKKDGTGLGLGISKRIVEDHAGSSLTVKSQEGGGTTVTITLPRYREGNELFKKTPERSET
jgi:signal transduction histidine kinase